MKELTVTFEINSALVTETLLARSILNLRAAVL